MNNNLLNVTNVAVLVGVSVQTINSWYKWKATNPADERVKLLPDYIQDGNRQARYWTQEDVWKLRTFKQSIPKGRNGIMGSVTQKYVKK